MFIINTLENIIEKLLNMIYMYIHDYFHVVEAELQNVLYCRMIIVYYWLKVKHIAKIKCKFSFLLTTNKLFLWYSMKAYFDAILCFIHYSCTSMIR